MIPHIHTIAYDAFHTFREFCTKRGLKIVDVERVPTLRLALVGVQHA
jgi:hypothetical protein